MKKGEADRKEKQEKLEQEYTQRLQEKESQLASIDKSA